MMRDFFQLDYADFLEAIEHAVSQDDPYGSAKVEAPFMLLRD